MGRVLSILSTVFGGVCCLIALAHLAMGPDSIPDSVPVNATMDSEDRFYATLFLGFGVAMIWAARDLSTRGAPFLALLAVFFLGGIARVISVLAVGWPHVLFIVLGAVELLLPPVFWWMHRRAHPGPTGAPPAAR